MTGVLYVVAMPIGNPGDLSSRAIDVLRDVGVIAAEDTRTTGRWLSLHGIPGAKQVSLHDHNEPARVPWIIETLLQGTSVALVSDAGTPLVSDPGYRLVSAAHEAGVRVSPVPGPCAAIAALSAAGLPSDRFSFEGFLPSTAAARRKRLQALIAQEGTLVFHEAPHRVLETLGAMAEVFGPQRLAAIAREVTKTHETIRRGTLDALLAFVAADENQRRGEIVLLVEGASGDDGSALDEGLLLRALSSELPATRAARVAATILGRPRRELYRQLLAMGARDADNG